MFSSMLRLAAVVGASSLAASLQIAAPPVMMPWKELGAATEFGAVKFSVAVKETGHAEIVKIARAVSDPRSAEYGKHLTSAQIQKLTAPAAADAEAVQQWLNAAPDCAVQTSTDRLVTVSCSPMGVSNLLNTTFRQLSNTATGQRVVRATELTIPAEVEGAVASVFGLHGLPLPPRRQPTRWGAEASAAHRRLQGQGAQPANVTPAVIAEVYKISGVKVDRKSANKQAVAEFQGQTMNETDLATYFDMFVPDAQPGDEKVHAFIGDNGDGTAADEATLDIQFIMGVAPGVKTDFYLYNSMDFCGDLKNWTSHLLKDEKAALVHSVSYGLQANMSEAGSMGCSKTNVAAVDSDFAKLAAKGISIIFASGDSGSGYSPSFCDELKKDTKLKGTVEHVVETLTADDCCEESQQLKAPGFTYSPAAGAPAPPKCKGTATKDEAILGVIMRAAVVQTAEQCCGMSAAMGVGYTAFQGDAPFYPGALAKCPDKATCCLVFSKINSKKASAGAKFSSGTNPAPLKGNCTLYSKVDGTEPSKGEVSGGSKFEALPKLFPSWPSTSPWVTAVGATRFVGQKVGAEQMATDQFGSGGGFSHFIERKPDAEYQEKAVSEYVKNAPRGLPFPPAAAVNFKGRANPDVSTLGEGYNIVMDNEVQSIGGTSASAPMFAGLVSLLNEARLAKGLKPMGFLNPFIYSNTEAFTDIVKGTNAVGRGNGPIMYGFNCTKGWDPATGVGTPLFDKLLKAAMDTEL